MSDSATFSVGSWFLRSWKIPSPPLRDGQAGITPRLRSGKHIRELAPLSLTTIRPGAKTPRLRQLDCQHAAAADMTDRRTVGTVFHLSWPQLMITMSTSSKTAPPNSTQVKLRPREHGAYSILGMPLLAGLLIGGVTPIGVLTTIAAVAGFLANEPLLVVWGNRGQRAKQSGTAATPTLICLLVTAIVCGGVALFLGSVPVQITLLFSLLLAVLGMVLSVMGHQRRLTAQIVGILGLTMPSAVVLLAGQTDKWLTLALTTGWVLGRIATTTSVRSIFSRQRASQNRRVPRIHDLILFSVGAVLIAGCFSGIAAWLTTTPLLLVAVLLRIRPASIQGIRRLGWELVAVNIVSCAWMVIWYAGPHMVGG